MGLTVGHLTCAVNLRQDHIQHILLSLAVKIEATHRPFEKRHLLLAYDLFVRLVCRELDDGGLETTRSFIVMDVIYTLVRVLSSDENGKYFKGEVFFRRVNVFQRVKGSFKGFFQIGVHERWMKGTLNIEYVRR